MKRNNGITLIALVITIIVLLILAGVAISMLSGENGILRKATEAKTKTEERTLEEQIKLAVMGATETGTSKVDKQKIADELGIDKNSINGNAKDIVLTKGEKTYNLKNGEIKEVSQIKEIDNELDELFQEKNLTYKCRYGYITGITEGEKVEKLQSALSSSGYSVKAEDGTDNFTRTDEDPDNPKPIVVTGLQIVNGDGTEVARTILFGELIKTGKIDGVDLTVLIRFLAYDEEKQKSEYTEYQLVAMDVDCDGKISQKDSDLLSRFCFDKDKYPIDQNQYACSPSDIIFKDKTKVLTEYINSLSEKIKNNDKYTIEKTEDSESKVPYVFKGIERGTTKVGELLSILPEGTLIVTHDIDSTKISKSEILNDYKDDTIDEDFTLKKKEYKYGIAIQDEYVGDIIIAYFE